MATKERRKKKTFINCLLLVNNVLACYSCHYTCAQIEVTRPYEWILFSVSHDCPCDYCYLHTHNISSFHVHSISHSYHQNKRKVHLAAGKAWKIACKKHFLYTWKPPCWKLVFKIKLIFFFPPPCNVDWVAPRWRGRPQWSHGNDSSRLEVRLSAVA